MTDPTESEIQDATAADLDTTDMSALGKNPAFVKVTVAPLREWARKLLPEVKLFDLLTEEQVAALPTGTINEDVDLDPFVEEPTLEQIYELNVIVANAQQYVVGGDAVGTKYTGPNGEVALRVADNTGPAYFKIIHTDGSDARAYRQTYIGEPGWTPVP